MEYEDLDVVFQGLQLFHGFYSHAENRWLPRVVVVKCSKRCLLFLLTPTDLFGTGFQSHANKGNLNSVSGYVQRKKVSESPNFSICGFTVCCLFWIISVGSLELLSHYVPCCSHDDIL